MRKLLVLLAPMTVALALAACGGSDTENVEPIGPTTSGAGSTLPAVDSKVYEGSGDQTIQIVPPVPNTPFVATLTNAVAGPFIVDSLDNAGVAIDNLVDTIGVYTGTVPVDFNPSLAKTGGLQIQAPGAWTVELKALRSLPTFTTDYSGTGDGVVVYNGERGNATFARTGKGPVVVTVYPSLDGGLPDTLVNDKDDVQTEVLIPSSGVVQVQTEGPWSFAPAG